MDHPMSEEAEMAMPINSTYVHSHPRLIQQHHHHHHHDQQSPQPFNHIIPSSNGTNTNTTMEAAEAPDQIAVIGNNSESFPTKKIKQSQQEQQKQQQQQQVVVVMYRECLKNHAAAMGGNATDGCGEFMPSGEEGTIEALTCSACNCHRNFHRKEIEGGDHNQMMMMIPSPSSCDCYHHLVNNRGSLTGLGGGGGHGRKLIALPGHRHHNHHSSSSKAIIAAATGAAAEPFGYSAGGHAGGGALVPAARSVPIMPFSSMAYMPSESDEQEGGGGGGGCGGSMGRVQTHQHHQNMVIKKRFRTKFTQEQKEKMFNFAEKVGWKIQKQEESVVQHFCEEIGVRRRVLKVWMHNNKHNLAKKQLHNSPSTA